MRRDRLVLVGLAVLAAALGAGCEETRTVAGPWGWVTDAGRTDVVDADLPQETTWAIALDSIDAPDHPTLAAQQAEAYERQTGLVGFWVQREPTRSGVYYGKYRSRTHHQAQADLARLKALVGRRGFQPRALALTPVFGGVDSQLRQFDLRQVAADPEAIYTLQVAVYDGAFEGDFRQAAEQHALRLRERGDEAYFYHGPRQSLVTVGVFYHGAVTVIQQGPRRGQSEYHPYIREQLQQAHPHMQVNGKPQPLDPAGRRFAPTVLVRVPR